MSLAVWLVVALAASASAAPSNLALASPSGRIDPQIVGGEVVDIKKVPYQVSIERNNGHICGGSVLTNSWILTAGHCLKGIPVSQLRVRVGSSTLQMGGSVHAVGAGYAHPHYVMYGQTYADFDVALLQLSTPVSLSDSVKTVKLPPSGKEPSTNTVVVASGWGLYSAQPGKRVLQGMSRPALQRDGLDGVEDEDVEQHHPVDAPALSKQLRRVTVRTILRKQCSDSYLKVKAYFTERMICAAAPAKDTCTYDSGGPLVDASGVQVGIVSWGRGCADARFPGVYTNIGNADIRAFIKTYTRL